MHNRKILLIIGSLFFIWLWSLMDGYQPLIFENFDICPSQISSFYDYFCFLKNDSDFSELDWTPEKPTNLLLHPKTCALVGRSEFLKIQPDSYSIDSNYDLVIRIDDIRNSERLLGIHSDRFTFGYEDYAGSSVNYLWIEPNYDPPEFFLSFQAILTRIRTLEEYERKAAFQEKYPDIPIVVLNNAFHSQMEQDYKRKFPELSLKSSLEPTEYIILKLLQSLCDQVDIFGYTIPFNSQYPMNNSLLESMPGVQQLQRQEYLEILTKEPHTTMKTRCSTECYLAPSEYKRSMLSFQIELLHKKVESMNKIYRARSSYAQYESCAIVGASPFMKQMINVGQEIDDHEVVLRFNFHTPTAADGSKTTHVMADMKALPALIKMDLENQTCFHPRNSTLISWKGNGVGLLLGYHQNSARSCYQIEFWESFEDHCSHCSRSRMEFVFGVKSLQGWTGPNGLQWALEHCNKIDVYGFSNQPLWNQFGIVYAILESQYREKLSFKNQASELYERYCWANCLHDARNQFLVGYTD